MQESPYTYKGVPRYNISYRLHWFGHNAANVLRLVMPYLVIKLKQAELAVKFQEIVDARYPTRSLITPLEKELREIFASGIKAYNHEFNTKGGM